MGNQQSQFKENVDEYRAKIIENFGENFKWDDLPPPVDSQEYVIRGAAFGDKKIEANKKKIPDGGAAPMAEKEEAETTGGDPLDHKRYRDGEDEDEDMAEAPPEHCLQADVGNDNPESTVSEPNELLRDPESSSSSPKSILVSNKRARTDSSESSITSQQQSKRVRFNDEDIIAKELDVPGASNKRGREQDEAATEQIPAKRARQDDFAVFSQALAEQTSKDKSSAKPLKPEELAAFSKALARVQEMKRERERIEELKKAREAADEAAEEALRKHEGSSIDSNKSYPSGRGRTHTSIIPGISYTPPLHSPPPPTFSATMKPKKKKNKRPKKKKTDPSSPRQPSTPRRKPKACFPFLQLPVEIQEQVFAYCHPITSVCLGLTSSRLYGIHFKLHPEVKLLQRPLQRKVGYLPLLLADWFADMGYSFRWGKVYTDEAYKERCYWVDRYEERRWEKKRERRVEKRELQRRGLWWRGRGRV